jgi:hypothetical protein
MNDPTPPPSQLPSQAPSPQPARKRAWTSFSLRTLLILVTVAGCYFGYEVNAVRQRKVMLKKFQDAHYIEVTKAADYAARFAQGTPPNKIAKVGGLRGLLGEEAIQEIGYYPHIVDSAELAEMKRWFPEARFFETRPMEPCHPGCFPWGTMIETAKGKRTVEQIQVGDKIIAIERTGEQKSIAVSSIFRTRNQLLEVHTSAGMLLTTRTQPLCVTSSRNVAAGELECGDSILIWKKGEMAPVKVLKVRLTERIEPVVNLVLDDSEAFVANGFLARSKPPAEPVISESGVEVGGHPTAH